MDSAQAAATTLRIFLVEDSPPVRERLVALLGSIEGACVCGHASGAEVAITKILADRPDVVILDLSLAQGNGIEVLRTLRDAAPEIDVYVLTTSTAPQYQRICMRLGASGFFDKSTEFETLRSVIAGRALDRTNSNFRGVTNAISDRVRKAR